MDEMGCESRLKELAADLGWKEAGLLNLNNDPDLSGNDDEQVNEAHSCVASAMLSNEERDVLVAATCRVSDNFTLTFDALQQRFSDR
jgi:hypothetical protein